MHPTFAYLNMKFTLLSVLFWLGCLALYAQNSPPNLAELDTLKMADGTLVPVLVLVAATDTTPLWLARLKHSPIKKRSQLPAGSILKINRMALPIAQDYLGHRDMLEYKGQQLIGNVSTTRRTNRLKLEMLDSTRQLKYSAFLHDSLTHIKRHYIDGHRRPYIGNPAINFVELGAGPVYRLGGNPLPYAIYDYAELAQRSRLGIGFTARVGRIYRNGFGLGFLISHYSFTSSVPHSPIGGGDTTFNLSGNFFGLSLMAATRSAPLQGVFGMTTGLGTPGSGFAELKDQVQIQGSAALRIRLSHRYYTAIEGSYLFSPNLISSTIKTLQGVVLIGFRV